MLGRFTSTSVWPWMLLTFALVAAIGWFVASLPDNDVDGEIDGCGYQNSI